MEKSLRSLLTAALGMCLMAAVPMAAACTLKAGEDVPTVILPVRGEASHMNFYAGLVQLALDKTKQDFGPCELRIVSEILPVERLHRHLAENKNIDILDATSSPERSRKFLAIEIPLLKGLMGHRILFIRATDLKAFAAMTTLADFQKLKAGQGASWPDVATLRANGIEVVTARNSPSLFRMLRAKRFDFFPRGAQEILDEQEQFDTHGLVVEPNLVLAYPSPVYFHVRKDDEALAERLGTGLWRAVADGSFDEYFRGHSLVREVYEKLHLEKRSVIFLCNPTYNDPRLLQDARLWIKPWPKDLCTEAR